MVISCFYSTKIIVRGGVCTHRVGYSFDYIIQKRPKHTFVIYHHFTYLSLHAVLLCMDCQYP